MAKEATADTIVQALDDIISGLEQAVTRIVALREVVARDSTNPEVEFDPKDPANKHEVGGLMKLTDRGVEICYRLFDAGKTRYAVKELMDISFGAANHRYIAWQKLGGSNRTKQTLQPRW